MSVQVINSWIVATDIDVFVCWNQPLLGLFHAEAGAGVWRRAVDDTLRSAEVNRCYPGCFVVTSLAGSKIHDVWSFGVVQFYRHSCAGS